MDHNDPNTTGNHTANYGYTIKNSHKHFSNGYHEHVLGGNTVQN